MVVDNDHFLSHADGTIVHFSHTDTAHIFIVVNGADQNLCARIRIAYRSGDIVEDRFKERTHIAVFIVQIQRCSAFFCGSEDKRTIKLLLIGIQINKEFQHFINDFFRPCFRAVDLVNADDNRMVQLQRFFQYTVSGA